MRRIRLEELRKVHAEIMELEKKCDRTVKQERRQNLWDALENMMEFNSIARREGLLALEEKVLEVSEDYRKESLKQLVCLLVDGTDPSILEQIGMMRYVSHLYTDYAALEYLIYLEGTLSIQAGENPRILEEKLKSMLSRDMYSEYSLKQECRQLEKEQEEEAHLIEKLCKGKRLWKSEDKDYYATRLWEYSLCHMEDKVIQRILREVSNETLTIAMKGMGGEARKRIFDNLSKRLGNMIAKGMMQLGPVRAVDILEACQQMLNVCIYLMERGELPQRYEYLEPFSQVFSEEMDKPYKKREQMKELKQLLTEYEQSYEMVAEFVERDEIPAGN